MSCWYLDVQPTSTGCREPPLSSKLIYSSTHLSASHSFDVGNRRNTSKIIAKKKLPLLKRPVCSTDSSPDAQITETNQSQQSCATRRYFRHKRRRQPTRQKKKASSLAPSPFLSRSPPSRFARRCTLAAADKAEHQSGARARREAI